DAPPLVFRPAFPDRGLEFPLRPVPGLRRVEDREVLADDLVLGVALDPFRPLVPAYDVSVRVEEEDGVILHRPDEQPETLLALAKLCFDDAALREVVCDLGVPDQLVVLPERREVDRCPEPAAVL